MTNVTKKENKENIKLKYIVFLFWNCKHVINSLKINNKNYNTI
jgi:hypothetical protein